MIFLLLKQLLLCTSSRLLNTITTGIMLKMMGRAYQSAHLVYLMMIWVRKRKRRMLTTMVS